MNAASPIQCAVLPAAGLGTRMRGIAGAKEMVELSPGKPAIAFLLDEAARAGIQEAFIVSRRDKSDLNEATAQWSEQGIFGPNMALRLLHQERPNGLARAIATAEEPLEGRPFLLMMPDNPAFGRPSPAEELMQTWSDEPNAAWWTLLPERGAYGAIFGPTGTPTIEKSGKKTFHISNLGAKFDHGNDPVAGIETPRTFGRLAVDSRFFEIFRRLDIPDDEIADDVPILAALAKRGELKGRLHHGPAFDCGIPEGLAAARSWLSENERKA